MFQRPRCFLTTISRVKSIKKKKKGGNYETFTGIYESVIRSAATFGPETANQYIFFLLFPLFSPIFCCAEYKATMIPLQSKVD